MTKTRVAIFHKYHLLCLVLSIAVIFILNGFTTSFSHAGGLSNFFKSSDEKFIEMVKNSTFQSIDSMTIGDIFETYKHSSEKHWSFYETERKQKIVLFRAKYNNDYNETTFLKFHNVSDELINKVKSYLGDYTYDVHILAEFLISKDGSRFELGYLGLETDKGPIDVNSQMMSIWLQNIYDNNKIQFPNNFFATYNDNISYILKKIILSELDIKDMYFVQPLDLTYIGHLNIETSHLPKIYHLKPKNTPLNLYKVKGIDFNDESKEIKMNIEVITTSATFAALGIKMIEKSYSTPEPEKFDTKIIFDKILNSNFTQTRPESLIMPLVFGGLDSLQFDINKGGRTMSLNIHLKLASYPIKSTTYIRDKREVSRDAIKIVMTKIIK